MKPRSLSLLVLAAWVMATAPRAHGQTEEELLALVRSAASVPARAEACRQLRVAATTNALPVLGPLLLDSEERLAHAARHALEGLPGPEASTALREAASRAPRNLRLGLIDSLGWRGDAHAVPLLEHWLLEVDDPLAAAAATALGRIGNDPAQAALEKARERVTPPVARALKESLLRIAERRVSEGLMSRALALYRSLQTPTEDDSVRQAGFAGEFRLVGTQDNALILRALESPDGAAQSAALRIAGEPDSPVPVATLTQLFPRCPAALKIGLIAALHRRGDPLALPAIAQAATSPETAVRLAAMVALGSLGDASVVPLVAEAATATEPALQSAARDVLTLIPRGDVTGAMVSLIPSASAPVARELFRALGARGEASALPELLRLARTEREQTRSLALQTLGTTAANKDLPDLFDLVLDTDDASVREEIRGVFETLIERNGNAQGPELDPLVERYTDAPIAKRLTLLPIAALYPDPRLRAALRQALATSDNPELRNAALQALASTRDPELLPDLLAQARRSAEASDVQRLSALLRGIVRLATDESVPLPPERRASTLASAYATTRSTSDRSTVIDGLARSSHRLALETAVQAASSADVRPEAELAALRIAQRLGASDFDRVESVLSRLAESALEPATRTQARNVLRLLDSGWVVCGPFRVEGREAGELFGVPFAPENTTGEPPVWRRVPGLADPARASEVELGPFTGGNHCVLYARTRVYSPDERDVNLALGSDDGLKLWLNGTLIHANNAVRGLVPGQDRATARLRSGWNEFLAKVTQHTAGCGLTVQITNKDGSAVSGLRFDARAGSAAEPAAKPAPAR
jgi:HEAT repeat protein